MTRLSVNINKVALIRNSRGSNLPDLRQFAMDCEEFGAEGITVHPRPDQRHIRYDDIPILKSVVNTEFNIEGYPNEDFMALMKESCPDQCTLVPDPPGVLTSNEGWKIKENHGFLSEIVSELQSYGSRVSLFIDPDPERVYEAKKLGADRVEIYTGSYATKFNQDREEAIKSHVETSRAARDLKVGLNAGHDLNLENLKFYKENTINLLEVSIGHALISDALYFGIQNAIQMYKNLLR